MRFRAALTVAVIVTVFSPSAAAASPATDRILELAHRAVFDDQALDRLKAISEIDGRSVDMNRVLEGASRDEVDDRVATLVTGITAGSTPVNPGDARDRAHEILLQRKFRPAEVPRPFRGILRTIAGWLDPIARALQRVWDAIVRAYNSLGGVTPGGTATLWLLLGIAVIVIAVLGTRRIIARRTRRHDESRDSITPARDDPGRLERAAAQAAAKGDHETAVRLLFRAGVIRLARARVIPPRRSLTTGDIQRKLHSPDFDRLGRSFDEIAYGGRRATKADSTEAHATWRTILDQQKVRT